MEKVVYPPNMLRNLFTIASVDNIDHNPSSATAKDSFHGTGIFLMQHQSQSFRGYDRGWKIIGSSRSSTPPVSFCHQPILAIHQQLSKQSSLPHRESKG